MCVLNTMVPGPGRDSTLQRGTLYSPTCPQQCLYVSVTPISIYIMNRRKRGGRWVLETCRRRCGSTVLCSTVHLELWHGGSELLRVTPGALLELRQGSRPPGVNTPSESRAACLFLTSPRGTSRTHTLVLEAHLKTA